MMVGPLVGGHFVGCRSYNPWCAGPFSGIVAVVASWLIAVRKIRILGEELGAEMPALVNVLVDHGGVITTIAVLIATVGIIALQWVRRPAVRNGISLVTSLILSVRLTR